MTQEKPFTLQVELCEGCNLRCPFCGINSIRKGIEDHRLFRMEIETADRIAEMLENSTWNPRIEFRGRGEPSLNLQANTIIKQFKTRLPDSHLMLLSNGGTLTKKRITDLFDAGLNILGLELYEGREDKITELAQGFPHVYYPQNKDWSPHKKHKEQMIILIENIAKATTGNHARLNNHAGSGAPLDYSKEGKRCARPFREMSINWDGGVAICCNDWKREVSMGNVFEYSSIDDLWNNDRYSVVRKYMYHGLRSLRPCHGCNAVSFRSGLLPDKFGKESLPLPTDADKKIWEGMLKCNS